MVRTYSAGVFAGTVVSRDGKEIALKDARRIWYWKGAASLSQLANRRNGGDSGSDAKPPKSEVTQEWPRANPDELKLFDEATKECTMNCGPHVNDPRTARERKFLCEDCINKEKKCK